jgi:RNA polymerase sigma-70 factor (ECF subfamily)
LPDEERAVLGLVSLDEMGYRQAAQILHVDVATVRSRLSHARHTLGDAIDGGMAPSANR